MTLNALKDSYRLTDTLVSLTYIWRDKWEDCWKTEGDNRKIKEQRCFHIALQVYISWAMMMKWKLESFRSCITHMIYITKEI